MNSLPSMLSKFLNTNAWLVQIWIIIITAFIINWVELIIFRRLHNRFKKTKKFWDDSLLEAVHVPFYSLVWLIAVIKTIAIIIDYLGYSAAFGKYPEKIEVLIFILFLFWCSFRYIHYLEQRTIQLSWLQQFKIDVTTIRAISQILRVTLVVITFLLVIDNLGINIATLLAAGGIGGIALGFAAKDTLSNFIGGMMVFWDRPFSVGDWVRSPDRQIEGTVENIGWRLTRILTFDKRPLYVPNGVFSNIAVENPSRMTNRRINTTIGLRYQDAAKMAVILRDIENMLQNYQEIDTTLTLMVNFFEFGPSSLNFFLYAFTKTTDWQKFQAVQQEVFLRVIDIITKHDAECAFPTTTLAMPEGLMIKQEQQKGISNE